MESPRAEGAAIDEHRAAGGGPLTPWLGGMVGGLAGRAGAWIYEAAIRRVNRRYDAGAGVTRLPIPVVSVGNLSVGGTGKTPLVVELVRELQRRGRRPSIAMRGYGKRASRGATAPESAMPEPGASPPFSPAAGGEVSDEEDVYHRLVPGVPVVAQPDRAAGLRALLASPAGKGVDVVVLDDGFQHRRVAREFDVVLVDASRDPFEDRLLPRGWLRETVDSLSRAGAVVVTHAELAPAERVERLAERVGRMMMRVRGTDGQAEGGAAPVGVCRHVWRSLRTGEERREVSWLKGRRTAVVCAIGNPAGFLAGAKESGATIVGSLVLPDHDAYGAGSMRRLGAMLRRHSPDVVLTTEKDWSKLRRGTGDWAGGREVVRPELSLRFDRGWEDVVAGMMRAIEARPGLRGE